MGYGADGIGHQMQPTSTSCGPTCVAMLIGIPVADVLAEFPKRYSSAKLNKLHRGQKITTNKTNVSEMWRLLKGYGKTMGAKHEVAYRIANRNKPCGLLRMHVKMASGHYRTEWHWLVIAEGQVYDPCASGPMNADQWFHDNFGNKIFFYEVE